MHVHSVKYAATLVHTRQTLSSTIIKSHQEPVSGQACNPLDPHCCYFPLCLEEPYGPQFRRGTFSLISVEAISICPFSLFSIHKFQCLLTQKGLHLLTP
jgi:hypothetical protein